MKNIFTNFRYYILFFFFLFAILGVFSVPTEDLPTSTWLYCLVSSKLLGLLAGWAGVRLLQRWHNKGTIPEWSEMVEKF